MGDIRDSITNKIKFDTTLIMLSEEPEFSEMFMDFAQHNDFVDLFEMARLPKYKIRNYGANEFKVALKMIDKNCPGLIEFKKKGWNGLWGYPQIRITEQGKIAADLLRSRDKK